MATTTTKVAEAISLLSDVLSKEVASSQHSLDDSDDTVSSEEHDDLKSLAEDFATDTQESLEGLQNELEAIVDSDDDDDEAVDYWSYDEDDEDDDDDESDDGEVDIAGVPGEREPDDPADDDETEPTDEVKIDMLTLAGAELEEKIEVHEQTIEDLKNTMSSVLDSVNTLLDVTNTFNDAVDAS